MWKCFSFSQYYATVDAGHEFDDDSIPWLSAGHVEDRPDPEQSSLQEMTSSGHSVGGIVDVTYSQVNYLLNDPLVVLM